MSTPLWDLAKSSVDDRKCGNFTKLKKKRTDWHVYSRHGSLERGDLLDIAWAERLELLLTHLWLETNAQQQQRYR